MMRVSGKVWFEVSKRGEQTSDYECSFVMWCSMMRVSGKVWFEVSKRGEQKYADVCSFVM